MEKIRYRKVLAILFTLACSVSLQAAENSIEWLLSGSDIVAGLNQIEALTPSGDCWAGQIKNTDDPYVILEPSEIDADKYKFLCVKLTTASASSLQIFFDREGFRNEDSVYCYESAVGDEPVTFVFDLSDIENWKSKIRRIRIDYNGASANDIVKICAVGISEKPIASRTGVSLVVLQPYNEKRERMAAHHETMIMTSETVPNTGVITYQTNFNRYLIAKFITAVEIDGNEISTSAARNIRVEDFPGGVETNYTINGIKVTGRQIPLIIGRDTEEIDGAVLYQVTANPAVPLIVRCGPGKMITDWAGMEGSIRSANFNYSADPQVELKDNLALLSAAQVPYSVAVTGKGKMTTDNTGPYGSNVAIRFENGQGQLLITFAPDKQKAAEIAKIDPDAQFKIFTDYYDKMMQSKIETPEPSIDEAFRTAIYNLEYNWLKPYGWIECIHHWTAVWHQQHTAGVEWLGQADRSRLCIETQANKSTETGGHIPNVFPDGTPFVSWSTNQYWAWELRHYWKYTADKEFAAQMALFLDKVLDVTWEQNDPENDLLLCWGQQIGNQEDWIDTPHNGTTPSISGIEMMRTRQDLAQALGDTDTVLEMSGKIELAKFRLRKELWKEDLGRFLFYKDPLKNLYLDGQYHTLIYPVIYDITDRFDSYTSVRHLRDRLMGEHGEIYCSNNFPTHQFCTIGPQSGAAQQPWGAWAFSAMGLRNETYRPLKAVSDWVNNPLQRGAWPEVDGGFKMVSYFSPPAGLFVASVAEALFGLKVNAPAEILEIAPSFPDSWPTAKLTLPEFTAQYNRNGNSLEYTVTSNKPLARKIRWLLPPSTVDDVQVDGRKVKYQVTPDIGSVLLTLETEKTTSSKISFKIDPLEYSFEYPKSIAQGDVITLNAKGCSILNIDDRCGVLKHANINPSTVTAKIRDNLLDPYLGFGRLGLMNFSRRTFFIECDNGRGIKFWQPIDLAILPRYEAAPAAPLTKIPAGAKVELLLRNNTSENLQGNTLLKTARTQIPINISIAPRSEKTITFEIPDDRLILLSTGDNDASLILPDGCAIDVTFDASKIVKETTPLANAVQARTRMLDLPEEDLVSDAQQFQGYNLAQWANQTPALQSLNPGILQDDNLPVTFKIPDRKLIPVSSGFDQPSYTVSLDDQNCKKIYLLIAPFLDNNNTFSKVGHVMLKRTDGRLLDGRELYFPGDLDWASIHISAGNFATFTKQRPDRLALLPLLEPQEADWQLGSPHKEGFPQTEFWARCRVLESQSAVMNVVEIDLEIPTRLSELTFSTIGTESAFGLVAVTVETYEGFEHLENTPYMPSREYQPDFIVFKLTSPEQVKDWQFTGEAFKNPCEQPFFGQVNLTSLAGGEAATGRALSPAFEIKNGYESLCLNLQGGRSEEGNLLAVDILDAETKEQLYRHLVKTGTHALTQTCIDVKKWQGKTVRLELIDENTNAGYAWLGVETVTLK